MRRSSLLLAAVAVLLGLSGSPAQQATSPAVSFDVVPRSLSARIGSDPRAWGAICDGVSDDTAALRAWAAATRAGDRLTLPNATCRFEGPITFPTVDGVSIEGAGRQSELRYAGAATTGTLITIGRATDPEGCSVKYWTIRDLRLVSDTVMTGGEAILFGHLCESEIRNISIGNDIYGDGNLFDGLHFAGGNSVRMIGYSIRTSNIGEIVHGDVDHQFTDLYQSGGGKIAKTRIGLLVGGRVGGLTVDQTDILLNGENIRIDRSRVPMANGQLFFGPGVAIDYTRVTGGFSDGIGVRLDDAGSYSSQLVFSGTWLASAQKAANGDEAKCLYVSAASLDWRITYTGGVITNCDGDGIRSDSPRAALSVVGTRIGDDNTGFGVDQTVPNPRVILSGIAWGRNGRGDHSPNVLNVSSNDRVQSSGTLLLNGRPGGRVALGLAGTTGIWVQGGAVLPGSATTDTAGGTVDLGSARHPFATLWTGAVQGTPTTVGSASSPCVPGKMLWDSGFIYVCTAPNTWKRAALSDF